MASSIEFERMKFCALISDNGIRQVPRRQESFACYQEESRSHELREIILPVNGRGCLDQLPRSSLES